MVICRTPFRISFFGGGTDHPSWYRENGGAVLFVTIDKYCYISGRLLPPFFEHKHRIVYSKTELVRDIDEIIHPAVREVFKYMNVKEGLEVHYDGDLPARTGIGSSSAFTVGLLHALYALRGKMATKKQLARDAIYVEQEMIKEAVGSQDQIASAYGGFNQVTFRGENNFRVEPVTLTKQRLEMFHGHLMLFFTGLTRYATEIETEKTKNFKNRRGELKAMQEMVGEAVNILNEGGSLVEVGKLLHESWKLKKSLCDKVSNSNIDHIYETAIRAGAIGGKILGAGGGGFILFFVEPEKREQVRRALGDILHVPFEFENQGSRVIYYTGSEIL